MNMPITAFVFSGIATLGVGIAGWGALFVVTRWTGNRPFLLVPTWEAPTMAWADEVNQHPSAWFRRVIVGPTMEEGLFRAGAGMGVRWLYLPERERRAIAEFVVICGFVQAVWVYWHAGQGADDTRKAENPSVMPAGAMAVTLRRLIWHAGVFSMVWWIIAWIGIIRLHAHTDLEIVTAFSVATIVTALMHMRWNAVTLRSHARLRLRTGYRWAFPWIRSP